MAKLIFSKAVIKEKTDILPIVGHEIIVYEKSGSKLTRIKHLSEEESFQEEKRSIFDKLFKNKPASYIGYAVDTNPNLEDEFTDVFDYNEFKSFDLKYVVKYRVTNAKRLVEKVVEAGEDALGNLRIIAAREIKETLLKYRDMEYIADEDLFKRYAFKIANIYTLDNVDEDADLRDISAVYDEINRKVGDVGLKVGKITISRRLSEIDAEDIKKTRRAEKVHQREVIEIGRNKVISTIKSKNQQEYELTAARHRNELDVIEREGNTEKAYHAELLQNIKLTGAVNRISETNQLQLNESNLHLRKAMNEAAEIVLKNIAGNVNTAADARRTVAELSRTFFELTSNSQMQNAQDGTFGRNELSAETGRFLPPKLKNKALNETVQLFSQVVELLSNSDISDETTKSLMSKVLYLVGELILGDDADEEKLGRYAEQTKKEFLSAMKDLNYDRLDQLRDLTDLEKLRKKFK